MALWFSNLSLTRKVVLMVGLLSAMAVLITLYSLRTLYQVDRDYRFLLNNDAQAAMLFGDAALELSLASREILTVLTEETSASMQTAQTRLSQHQVRLITHIEALKPLLPERLNELDSLLERQQQMFTLSAEAVSWAARWRGDKALKLIREQYNPALKALKADLLGLHSSIVTDYQRQSQQLRAATKATLLNSALAFFITLVVGIGLTARLSLHHLSYPVSELTQVMRRLTRRDYPPNIAYTRREDEIGQMAKALEVFSSTMQNADRLERDQAITNAKASFLANISHEIRTPANAILGMTQQVLKHPLEPCQQQRMQRIDLAGEHLRRLINDLLDFSRLDSEQPNIDNIRFQPTELIHELHQMVEQQALEKGLTLYFEPVDDLPELWGDPHRIKQILLNYLSNAIKFSERGQVRLSLRLEQPSSQLCWLYAEVSDEGEGIAAEHQATIFSPFEQLPDKGARRQEGTGLGLAICRRLATLMGGETGLTSEPGKGCTFWCRVKVRPVAPAHQTVNLSVLAGKRLLVVDDNELNLLVITELLEDAGIMTETAGSGEAALSRLGRPDLPGVDGVLLDVMMPGLNGLDTCRRIRERAGLADLPVIALTANSAAADVLQCFKAGMNGHIAKPIDEQQLWLQLCELLAPMPLLDTELLQRLQQRMPPVRFMALLNMTQQSCRQWQQQLAEAAESEDWPRLRQLAHNMAGSAGQAGLTAVAAQARRLGTALKQQPSDHALQRVAGLQALCAESVLLLQSRITTLSA